MATNQNPTLNARLFRGPHVLGVVRRIGQIEAYLASKGVIPKSSRHPTAHLNVMPQPMLQRIYRDLVRS
jgi:hypothetical protein